MVLFVRACMALQCPIHILSNFSFMYLFLEFSSPRTNHSTCNLVSVVVKLVTSSYLAFRFKSHSSFSSLDLNLLSNYFFKIYTASRTHLVSEWLFHKTKSAKSHKLVEFNTCEKSQFQCFSKYNCFFILRSGL